MNYPLTLDSPIGPITAPPGHAERARDLTDKELRKKMNADGLVDPTALHVALHERPHLKRKRRSGGGTHWEIRDSSLPPARMPKPQTINDVQERIAQFLARGDGVELSDEDFRLLTLVQDTIFEADSPVSVSALIEAWVGAGGERDNWRVYDAVKFLRERGLIRCVGSPRGGKLAQQQCYVQAR
jgi:hypothetical protein